MANPPFPVENSTTSFWRSSNLHSIDNFRSPDFPSEADIVIIGAGYTGASLAHHILNLTSASPKKPSIAILEAREACSGATGRNGGHLKPDGFLKAATALDEHGKEAAEEVATFETRHIAAIGDLVREEGIECDFVVTRAIDVCLYDKGGEEMEAKLARLREAGVDVGDVFYCSEESAEGFSGFKGARGCFSSTTAHLWPYKLVTHLLAKAVSQGVNLQTWTPVSSVSSTPSASGRYTITTPRGTIAAAKVIYATNGYTSALLPQLSKRLVPVRGICSRIVCPPGGGKRAPLLTNSYVVRFNDWEYDYLIPRTDGSIVVGGARRDYYRELGSWFGVHDDSKLMSEAEKYFDGYMQRHFHGWQSSGAVTESVWTGIMGYTTDGYPFIGEVPEAKGQFVCAGFNGHGMPQAFLSAKAIASMVVHGTKVEETDLPRLYRCTPARLASQDQHVSLKAYGKFEAEENRRKRGDGREEVG